MLSALHDANTSTVQRAGILLFVSTKSSDCSPAQGRQWPWRQQQAPLLPILPLRESSPSPFAGSRGTAAK